MSEVKVLFTCTECGSDQEVNPYKNQWIQSGVDTLPCKFCGGVAIYIENPDDRDRILERWNLSRRGIGQGPTDGNLSV